MSNALLCTAVMLFISFKSSTVYHFKEIVKYWFFYFIYAFLCMFHVCFYVSFMYAIMYKNNIYYTFKFMRFHCSFQRIFIWSRILRILWKYVTNVSYCALFMKLLNNAWSSNVLNFFLFKFIFPFLSILDRHF